MQDLTPKFCPHCLADFARELVEVKTSNPPKCGRCLLPLWWEDRSGKLPDRPWPSYAEILRLRGGLGTATTQAAVLALIEDSVALREIVAKLEKIVGVVK